MQIKPIATYKAGTLASLSGHAKVGERVMVHCIDHPAPRLCGAQVITTPVTREGNFGVFETANTVYMPEERLLPVVIVVCL
jgi:hypothetical protein